MCSLRARSSFISLAANAYTFAALPRSIACGREDAFFEKAITMFHKYVSNVTQTQEAAPREKTEFSFMIASAIGSTIGVLHKWTAENFETPAEEVAGLMSKVFLSGILPYLS